MSTPNALALVQTIKADLVANGARFQTNEDAAQITWRVAWHLRDQGARLFLKTPAQNGAVYQGLKYGHDTIAFPDGWVDCLVSAGPPANGNGPTWDWHPGAPSGALAPPFDLDATTEPIVIVDPDPPATPSSPPDPVLALAALTFQLALLQERVGLLHTVVEHVALVQARGVSGSLFGYTLTLLPVPPPKDGPTFP